MADNERPPEQRMTCSEALHALARANNNTAEAFRELAGVFEALREKHNAHVDNHHKWHNGPLFWFSCAWMAGMGIGYNAGIAGVDRATTMLSGLSIVVGPILVASAGMATFELIVNWRRRRGEVPGPPDVKEKQG